MPQTSRKSTGGKQPRRSLPPAPKSPVRDDGQPFRFLDLPPELRNRIYNYIFIPDKESADYLEPDVMLFEHFSPSSTLSRYEWGDGDENMFCILQTCRQIYNEASSIPYANNHLYFAEPCDIETLTRYASGLLLLRVRKVEMHLDFDAWEDHYSRYWDSLALFPNLLEMRFVVDGDDCKSFLAESDHEITTKIGILESLKNLKVFVCSITGTIDWNYGQHPDAVELTKMWSAFLHKPEQGNEE